MKRYLVWAGEQFYAAGPKADFVGDFDSLDDVRAHERIILARAAEEFFIQQKDLTGEMATAMRRADEWVRILDTEAGEWVAPIGPIYGEGDDG